VTRDEWPRTCAVCGKPTTVDGTIEAAGGKGKWAAYPAVRHEDGRVGHVRCFIGEGTVFLGGRTGPELLAELDESQAAWVASLLPEPRWRVN